MCHGQQGSSLKDYVGVVADKKQVLDYLSLECYIKNGNHKHPTGTFHQSIERKIILTTHQSVMKVGAMLQKLVLVFSISIGNAL